MQYKPEIPNVTPVIDFKFDVNKLIEEYLFLDKNYNSSFESQPMARKLHVVRFGKDLPKFLSLVPYTREVALKIKEFFDYDCITYRVVLPQQKYTWHIDKYPTDHCYHIPLITNPKCEFVYDKNLRYTLPVGNLYKAMTNVLHTFENNGLTERVHITFEKQIGMTV